MEQTHHADASPTQHQGPRNPVKVIRQYCLWCTNGSPREVELCSAPECPLYPWRFGRNPYRKPRSKKAREAAKANIKKAIAAQSNCREILSDAS